MPVSLEVGVFLAADGAEKWAAKQRTANSPKSRGYTRLFRLVRSLLWLDVQPTKWR